LDNTIQNSIENLINSKLNDQDLIKELLTSSNINSPFLISDSNTKKFYIYPYNNPDYSNHLSDIKIIYLSI